MTNQEEYASVGQAFQPDGQAVKPDLRGRLVLLGCLSLLIYGGVSVLSFRFRYGEGHRDRPILVVLALLAAAVLGYLLALAAVLRQRRKNLSGGLTPPAQPLRIILLFSVAYRLVLLPSAPIQEIDYYRYLWDGRVCLGGINPYRFSPQEVDQGGANSRGVLRAVRPLAIDPGIGGDPNHL